MFTIRSVTAAAVGVVAALTLAACSSSGSGAADDTSGQSAEASSDTNDGSASDSVPATDATITMWTFLDPTATDPRSKVLAGIIESFEKDNPGAHVKVESKPYQTLTSAFLSAATAGNAPDITWTVLDDLSTVVGQQALVDLSTSSAFTSEDTSDFSVWDQLKVGDSGPYGVVMSLNYYGLLYRADMLKDAGLQVSDLATWDSFATSVQKLTNASAGISGFGQAFGGQQGDPQIMVPMTLDSQDSMFDADGKADWATSQAADALKYETDFVASGVTPKNAAQWEPNDLYDQFAAGTVAVMNGASTRVSAMQQQIGEDKVGFAPYPSTDGTSGSRMFNGWSVGVWQGSENKDLAERFVAYLANAASDTAWAVDAGQIPLRKSTLETADVSDSVRTAANGIAENGWRPPLNAPTFGWTDDLNAAAQAVVLTGAEPQQALQDSAAKFDSQ